MKYLVNFKTHVDNKQTDDKEVKKLHKIIFKLMDNVVDGLSLHSSSADLLNEIFILVNKYTPLCNDLVKNKKFITISLPITFLSKKTFKLGILVLHKIIEVVDAVPDRYKTRDFLFFMTNKLFDELLIYNEAILSEDQSFVDFSNYKESGEPNIGKIIINLISLIIEIEPFSVAILKSLGFFKLINGIKSVAVAKLYNTLFHNIYYDGIVDLSSITGGGIHKNGNVVNGSVYEITRSYFDPEVILKEKEIFCHTNPQAFYKRGIYLELYENLISENFVYLLALSPGNCINIVNYKRNGFQIPLSFEEMCKRLSEDYKDMVGRVNIREKMLHVYPVIFKYYRRLLESGKYPFEDNLAFKLLGIFGNITRKSLIRDISIILFYYCEEVRSFSLKEEIIHKIFRTLEYSCEKDCPRIGNCLSEDDAVEMNVNLCGSIRIVGLIQAIYTKDDPKFYKPSFLILLKAVQNHVPELEQFISTYFRDFISYIFKNDTKNISRVFIDIESKISKANTKKMKYKLLPIIQQQPNKDNLDSVNDSIFDEIV